MLRISEVMRRSGLKRSTIYHRIKEGRFVPPVKNGSKISVWPEEEVYAINRAIIAGKGVDEIKTLVEEIVENRKM